MHNPKAIRVLSSAVRVKHRGCREIWKEYTASTCAGGRKKDVLVFLAPPGDTIGWWRREWEAQILNSKRVAVGLAVLELLEL